MTHSFRPLAVPLAVLLAACGPDSNPAGWAGTIDTLLSGRIVVQNPAGGTWTPETAWRLVEEVRIGAVEDDGPAVFGAVNDVAVDGVGRIYVLDRQAQDIRVFAPDGSWVRTMGNDGEGPGEFRQAHGLAIGPHGRLWVVDSRLRRFTVFDTSGGFLTTYPRRVLRWGYIWKGDFLQSGKLYDETGAGPIGNIESALTLFDTTGSAADTVRLPTYEEAYVRFEYAGGATVTLIPFRENLFWRLDPRGFIWSGVSNEYTLHQVNLSGDTVRSVSKNAKPMPVTASERDSAMSLLRERARGGPVDVAIPAVKPYYVGLDTDDQGYLWVRVPTDASEPKAVFDVFDVDGRFLGTLEAALRISDYLPVWIYGDLLYAVHNDELDVPFVVRLRITGREKT